MAAAIEEQTIEKELDMEISNRKYIPNDIIAEILSRVPANSLLRLRWASKYLFNLITRDPDFHKLHLHRSSDHDLSVLSSASYSLDIVRNYNIQCHLNYKTGSVSCNKQNIACPLEPCNQSANLITCINGLMFFRIEKELDKFCIWNPFEKELDKFCIWNPCTKEYRVLSIPDPPKFIKFNGIRGEKRCVGRYGFGYDHTINDYKVVRNDYYYDEGHNFLASDVQIYTLGTDSWRSIGPVPVSYEQHRYRNILEGGVFVNGALHWLLDPSGQKIVSFDIVKEEYKEVLIIQLQPKILDGAWNCTMELQVFEGSLCCLVAQHTNNPAVTHKHHFEMWMMKDYDDVNNSKYSWTELYQTSTANYHHLTLLRLTQDGEILMLKGRDLVAYDPDFGTRTLSKICEDEKCNHVVDAVYTESLVSLNSGTYYTAGHLKNQKRKNDQR